MITVDELKQIAPKCRMDYADLANALSYWLPKYDIDTEERVDQFLAQALHETCGFIYIRELGGWNYFKKYDGRKDLGNIKPGDGYRFRGRGIFQLTGRYNYTTIGLKIGVDLVNHPEQAELPWISVHIACLYWQEKGCNALADAGDIRAITRKINGGLNGFQDRLNYLKKLIKIKIWL